MLRSRVVQLEAAAERRLRQEVAEVVAEVEGVSVVEVLSGDDVEAEDLEAVVRAFPGSQVDVAEMTRFLAARVGLTAEETEEAAEKAGRVLELLRERNR